MNGVETLSAIKNRPTAVIIADQLREGIVSGTFASGDQINEAQLAERLQVSRGPVREALHRLVQEGLLEGRPNRGVFVKEVTRRDIAEVAEAREVIECAAAEVITGKDQVSRNRIADGLVEAAAGMTAALAADDKDGLRRADLAFHTQLVRSGENTRLLRAYTTLATEALICMLHFGGNEADQDLIDSHVAIAELLRAGDMEAVHLALHDHLSIDELDIHSHDDETLRHGRVEG
ncbi:GntR family transcriptional regulator [Agrococcus sp. 1P02AA]|uniref:GntR family transcriptional regulator n=1 Tax=Agrococcus sp. 1P02AA TaxID=3132259 RepID=UPI0039A5CFC6